MEEMLNIVKKHKWFCVIAEYDDSSGCECSIAQPASQPADQTGLGHFHRTKQVVFQKRLKNPVQKAKKRY
jgi:competence protein ComEA